MLHCTKTPGIILVLVFTSIFLCQIALVAGSDFSDIPSEGNRLVSDKETLLGITRLWNGNITIVGGGELIISQSKLIFNSTNATHQGFFVETGGKIIMRDSMITTTNASEGFLFFSNGSVEIRRCRIESIYDYTVGLKWMGGFRIYSDNPVIEDSIFIRASGYAIRFEGCENVLFANNIVTQASTAIHMNRSTGVLRGNWFQNNSDRQVIIHECDGVEFTDNVINRSGMGAFVVVRSKNLDARNNTYDGPFYVIYATGSTAEFVGEEVTGDQIQVEGRENSKLSFLDCSLDLEKIQVKSGSEITVRRIVELRVLSGEKPVANAIITVKDAQGTVVVEDRTDDGGIAQFVILEAVVKESGLERYGPYEFKAVKGLYSASGSADISINPQIELEMSFPWLLIIGFAVILILVIVIVVMPPKQTKRKRLKSKRK